MIENEDDDKKTRELLNVAQSLQQAAFAYIHCKWRTFKPNAKLKSLDTWFPAARLCIDSKIQPKKFIVAFLSRGGNKLDINSIGNIKSLKAVYEKLFANGDEPFREAVEHTQQIMDMYSNRVIFMKQQLGIEEKDSLADKLLTYPLHIRVLLMLKHNVRIPQEIYGEFLTALLTDYELRMVIKEMLPQFERSVDLEGIEVFCERS